MLLLARSADETGLPSDAEVRAAFTAYLEWGSRIAFENSQPGIHPPPHMLSYDVASHADAIAERLRAGTMPCDGPWPPEQVDVFERWVAAGSPP